MSENRTGLKPLNGSAHVGHRKILFKIMIKMLCGRSGYLVRWAGVGILVALAFFGASDAFAPTPKVSPRPEIWEQKPGTAGEKHIVDIRDTHKGPLGVQWTETVDGARRSLDHRFKFLGQTVISQHPHNVVEIRYGGRFANMPVKPPMRLRFFKDKLFRLDVLLAPVTRMSKLFEVAVERMRSKYGDPEFETRPTKLYSNNTNWNRAEVDSKNQSIFQGYTWKSTEPHYAELDAQIHSGHWRPYAKWTFSNDVEIKIFVDVRQNPTNLSRVYTSTRWQIVKVDLDAAAAAPNLHPKDDF